MYLFPLQVSMDQAFDILLTVVIGCNVVALTTETILPGAAKRSKDYYRYHGIFRVVNYVFLTLYTVEAVVKGCFRKYPGRTHFSRPLHPRTHMKSEPPNPQDT